MITELEITDLAYDAIRDSPLYDLWTNDQWDAGAEALAAEIEKSGEGIIDEWITQRVRKAE